MRILELIDGLRQGGAEVLLEQFVNNLIVSGHQVVVCSMTQSATDIGNELRKKVGDVVDLRYSGRLDFIKTIYNLSSVLREHNIQVLHSHLFKSNLVGALTCLGKKIGFVPTQHNTLPWASAAHFASDRELVSRRAYKYVAVTNSVADFMQKEEGIARNRISVVPNGVDCARFEHADHFRSALRESWQVTDDTIVVVTVASLTPKKGHSILLEAAADVIRKNQYRWQFVLVGDGTLRATLEKQVQDLGLVDNVIFLGMRHDVPSILSASDIFLLASLWEGLPVAMLEAMATGLPVISTSVGGIPDVIQHLSDGFLIEPNSPKLLAEGLISLANNKELRNRLGNAARERVKRDFNLQSMHNSLRDILELAVRTQYYQNCSPCKRNKQSQ